MLNTVDFNCIQYLFIDKMASASAPASIYPRSDSRLPNGSVYTFSRASDLLSTEHVAPPVEPVLETDPEFLQAVADYEASNRRCMQRWGKEAAKLSDHFDGVHHFGHNSCYWNKETWERNGKRLKRFMKDREDFHKEAAIQAPILERFGLDRIEAHLKKRGILSVIAETRAEIEAEVEAERQEALHQQMARPQMTADELRNGIRKFKESRRKEQFDLNTIDEDWQFPKIVAAAELNLTAERKFQRRLIAAYGTQVLCSNSTETSDSILLGMYRTFLERCIGRADAGRLSDEEIEIRFQFLDQDLHTIYVHAQEMKENEPHKERHIYYMQKWQKAKEKHDELTAKLEEFISQHGRQIVSDLI